MKPKIVLISLFNIDFGLRYISSYLNSKGYSTNIISFGMLRLKGEIFRNNYITSGLLHQKAYSNIDANLLINLLSELQPSLIGFSVPSTTFITAKILTRKIKERFNIPIVWGGIHPTLCPEDCIQHADIVCIGEGEYPMYELAQKLENNEEITAINNLWIKCPDGSTEKNELRGLILNLDSLPYPDFLGFGNKFLIDRGKIIPDPIIVSSYLKNAYPIMSSRGCHFNCSFCCNSILKIIYKDRGPYLRRRTPENVIDELVYMRKQREVIRIKFWDDIFTFDEDWIERFHQLYIEKVSVPFTCFAHPKYTNKKIIQMLAEAGLISVDVGIQSGSKSFCRDRLKRQQSNEEIIEFSYILKKLNVIPRYHVIVDNPYESDEDSEATVELLIKLPQPYIAALYSLCYFPKTELTNQALKDGIITEEEIESRTNKALNNFYMFIELAKDKRRFFWDIIIAMVVSHFFSQRLIKGCKHSRFMRNHPRLLLTLIRLYLRTSLFSPVSVFSYVLTKRAHSITKLYFMAPRFFTDLIKLYIKTMILRGDTSNIFMLCNLVVSNLENLTTEANNQTFKDKTKIDLLVFPKEPTSSTGKGFHLKIKQREYVNSLFPYKLSMELVGISNLMSYLPRKRLGLWEIDFEIDDTDIDMELELLFPYMFFGLKGIKKQAIIKEVRNIRERGLYVLNFFLYSKFQKTYILKNCILIHMNELLNYDIDIYAFVTGKPHHSWRGCTNVA